MEKTPGLGVRIYFTLLNNKLERLKVVNLYCLVYYMRVMLKPNTETVGLKSHQQKWQFDAVPNALAYSYKDVDYTKLVLKLCVPLTNDIAYSTKVKIIQK